MNSNLLDSNVIILYLRREPLTVARMAEWVGNSGHISVVTRAEVFAGAYPEEEEATRDLLDSLIPRKIRSTIFRSLPVTSQIADRAGRWIHQYARRGIQLSFPDALIAATAALHNLTLVTTNAKHFPMPELRVQTLEQ